MLNKLHTFFNNASTVIGKTVIIIIALYLLAVVAKKVFLHLKENNFTFGADLETSVDFIRNGNEHYHREGDDREKLLFYGFGAFNLSLGILRMVKGKTDPTKTPGTPISDDEYPRRRGGGLLVQEVSDGLFDRSGPK